MKYNLEREINWSSYRIGLVIIVVFLIFLIVFTNLIPGLTWQTRLLINTFVISVHFMLIYLIFVANRRFIRRLIFDFDNSTIEFYSIIRSIKKEIPINDLKEIKIIKSQGFGNIDNGFNNHNLVLRIKNNFQPQIFEIRNISDFEKVNTIIEKLNTTHNKGHK